MTKLSSIKQAIDDRIESLQRARSTAAAEGRKMHVADLRLQLREARYMQGIVANEILSTPEQPVDVDASFERLRLDIIAAIGEAMQQGDCKRAEHLENALLGLLRARAEL